MDCPAMMNASQGSYVPISEASSGNQAFILFQINFSWMDFILQDYYSYKRNVPKIRKKLKKMKMKIKEMNSIRNGDEEMRC